jgi:hypothetical protein
MLILKMVIKKLLKYYKKPINFLMKILLGSVKNYKDNKVNNIKILFKNYFIFK